MTDRVRDHLSELQIAGYIDRRLSAAETERVEHHLAECAECRAELSGSQQLINRARRPRRIAAISGLLAAAAAVVIVLRVSLATSTNTEPVTRGADAASNLVAYSPIGETTRSKARFIWSSATDVASYRLNVSGGDGVQVWTYSGTDTTAALPASVALKPGTRYLWFVDAILLDGTTRSTGMREFTLLE